MAITVKHKFVSAIPDAGDPTIVQPSNWNDDHQLVGTVPIANGGTNATTAADALTNLGAYPASNPSGYGTGSVTSVAATAGTGISVTGSPITTSGTLNITNTAPDQTVVLNAGTGISTSGTYPNFTITNTSPSSGGTVTSVSGTGTVNGISLTGTVTTSGSLTLGGTLGGIANSQLTNSTISGVSLGLNLNALTIGTGLSGTSYNGSTPTTIAIANSGVTAGTYGSAAVIPVIQVNSQGQITNISTQPTNAPAYQGTWNASTNTPILVSSVGTAGYYYVVSVAGNTTLNGVSGWAVGDWAIFENGAWQKIAGSSSESFTNLTTTNLAVTGLTGYMYANNTSGNVTASTTIPNTAISGLGTMSTQNANAVAITGGTINGTSIGATTPSFGAFTYLSTSGSTSTTPTLSFNASNSPIASGASISGSYLQFVLQNKSGTAGASTNYVLSNDLGTDSSYYGEFGMNSSVYSSGTPADFFSLNNGIYFSGHDGDLTVGSGNGYKTYIAWGTTGQSAHVINASGAIGLNTSITGSTNFGTSGQVLTSGGSAATPTWTTPTTGTVTSVAQSFTGGIISVTGSPITSSGTLALSVAGTSGGIPYFSSTSTWATSAVLAANALMIGGGAGVAPSTITTGTGVNTALGVNTGTVGAFVVNGGALGTPSSGTVTNLTGTASININGTVGATTATTGAFTTVSATGVITSTLATGTAPFTVASTTQVANLNAATAGSAGTATTATNLAGGNNTTLLGSMPYQSNTNVTTLLSPNTSTTKNFLTQTGTGTNGAVPAWGTIAAADVPTLNQNTTGTAANITASSNTSLTSLANLATVGTIGTGTWNGSIIAGQYGGTGIANTGKTITLGGNLTTSGAFTTTLTVGANTSLTLPTSGTVISTVTNMAANPVTGTPSASNFLRGDGTWASPVVGSGTYNRTNFTATAGQTSFTVSYTVNFVEVFVNGVLLDTTDYTATSGTAIVLATAAALNDIVTVIAYNTTTATTAAGSTTQVQYNSGGNFAGSANLTFDGTTLTAGGLSGPHNGTVGATTPNTVVATQLTVNGSNLNTSISPTGTGTVTISPAGALTINPTAASTINNASIGATTASTGRFTSVTLTTTPLAPASGGTGVATVPTNGQIPIGNGTNYVAATLTQGTGISVTNASGAITIANTGTLSYSGAGVASLTTTLTSTGLSAALGVGTYRFTATIYGQSSSTAGVTFQTAFTGTTTSIEMMQSGQASSTTMVATNRVAANATNGTAVWTTATTEMYIIISGVIVTSTAGTFTINAAKVTSGTGIIRAGSNLIIG